MSDSNEKKKNYQFAQRSKFFREAKQITNSFVFKNNNKIKSERVVDEILNEVDVRSIKQKLFIACERRDTAATIFLWGQSLKCLLSHFHYYAKLSAADVLDMSWPLRQSHFWWRWTDNWLNNKPYRIRLCETSKKKLMIYHVYFCRGALIKISICEVFLLMCAREWIRKMWSWKRKMLRFIILISLLFTQNNIALDEWVDECVRVWRTWDISFFWVLWMNHQSYLVAAMKRKFHSYLAMRCQRNN